jgi:hypothetical protein
MRALSAEEAAVYSAMLATGSQLAEAWLFVRSLADADGNPLLRDDDVKYYASLNPKMRAAVMADVRAINPDLPRAS